MAQQLLDNFFGSIDSLELIPSGGGRFEVIANGQLIYSKKATGRHAEYDEVASSLQEILAG